MVTPQHFLATSYGCTLPRVRQILRMYHVGKLHSKHSCILIQESYWITIYLNVVKWFKIESSDIFQILAYFVKYLTIWGITIVFPQVPLFKKMSVFSIYLLIPAWGHFATIKTSHDEVSFEKILDHLEPTYFIKTFWRGTYRHVGPICSELYSQSENPGITLVSIGHWTLWPENPGYRTQVWIDKFNSNMDELNPRSLEWISNFNPHPIMDVLSYPCQDLKLMYVSKEGLMPLFEFFEVNHCKKRKCITSFDKLIMVSVLISCLAEFNHICPYTEQNLLYLNHPILL